MTTPEEQLAQLKQQLQHEQQVLQDLERQFQLEQELKENLEWHVREIREGQDYIARKIQTQVEVVRLAQPGSEEQYENQRLTEFNQEAVDARLSRDDLEHQVQAQTEVIRLALSKLGQQSELANQADLDLQAEETRLLDEINKEILLQGDMAYADSLIRP